MIDPNIIANLHAYITINPQLAIVGERLQLKRLVPMAVDRAIVEIIAPVVDRSVTIACMTAQVGGGRGWGVFQEVLRAPVRRASVGALRGWRAAGRTRSAPLSAPLRKHCNASPPPLMPRRSWCSRIMQPSPRRTLCARPRT